MTQTWVVVMRINGESHVYATADSRSEARATAAWLWQSSQTMASVMTWDEAEACGLVS